MFEWFKCRHQFHLPRVPFSLFTYYSKSYIPSTIKTQINLKNYIFASDSNVVISSTFHICVPFSLFTNYSKSYIPSTTKTQINLKNIILDRFKCRYQIHLPRMCIFLSFYLLKVIYPMYYKNSNEFLVFG